MSLAQVNVDHAGEHLLSLGHDDERRVAFLFGGVVDHLAPSVQSTREASNILEPELVLHPPSAGRLRRSGTPVLRIAASTVPLGQAQ